VGHHASEHFSLARLGQHLATALPEIEVVAAATDCDPITWLE
jgi:hypothetical protein